MTSRAIEANTTQTGIVVITSNGRELRKLKQVMAMQSTDTAENSMASSNNGTGLRNVMQTICNGT